MKNWQADFYRIPTDKTPGLWELLICDVTGDFHYSATCPQSEANSQWLITQLKLAANSELPAVIQVFRPQCLSLMEVAATQLGITVQPTRNTPALKQWLQAKQYPIVVDKPPPAPLPENLWGESWRFASIPAGDILDVFTQRPIPILSMPESLQPLKMGLAFNLSIPGVVIYGGRKSLILARWLEAARPVSLNYLPGEPDGLILEAGLVDRWIMVTFTDTEVMAAGKVYQQRLSTSRGLHFLLVQPDDSGITYTGFWLLGKE